MLIKFYMLLVVSLLLPSYSYSYTSKRKCLQQGKRWNAEYRRCEALNFKSRKLKRKSKYKKWNDKYSSSSKSKTSSSTVSVYGDSDTYFRRDRARRLARLDAKNKAGEKCGSSYKAEISWVANGCDKLKSSSSNQYKCWIRAKVKCHQDRCRKRYCGSVR